MRPPTAYQRITPPRKVCAHSGSRPVKSEANHPITITKKNAMKRMYKTMNCGMARMRRKATVNRFCATLPANHISTRLVGMIMGAFVISPHLPRHPSAETSSGSTLEHPHRRGVDLPFPRCPCTPPGREWPANHGWTSAQNDPYST